MLVRSDWLIFYEKEMVVRRDGSGRRHCQTSLSGYYNIAICFFFFFFFLTSLFYSDNNIYIAIC